MNNDLIDAIGDITNSITELERDVGSTLGQEIQAKIDHALPNLYNARARLRNLEDSLNG